MMTKEQHIAYWVDIAGDDWKRKELHFDANDYVFCLYLAHQTLEKLAKANWVRVHQDNIPPRVHNIVYLLEQSNIYLEDDLMSFIRGFNSFQLTGRYPDYLRRIDRICTKDYTCEQLEKLKEVRQCLLAMLQ